MPMSDYHMVPLSAQYANPSPFSENGQSQMYRKLDGNQKEIRKLCEHLTNDEKAHLERRVNRQFFLQRSHGLGLGWSSTSSLGEISASSHAAISIVQMFKRAHLEPASFLQEFSHCFLQISYYTSPLEPGHFWSRFQHFFQIYSEGIIILYWANIYDQCFLKLFRIVFNFRYVWSKMALGNKNRWLSR